MAQRPNVLLLGTLADRTMRAVLEETARRAFDCDVIDLAVLQLVGGMRVSGPPLDVALELAGTSRRLQDYNSIFVRWNDIAEGAPTEGQARAARTIYQGLGTALQQTAVRAMNRPFTCRALFSKIFQVARFAHGYTWKVPRSLVTNDIVSVTNLLSASAAGLIVKGCSGHKTWVAKVSLEDLQAEGSRLNRCPALFQEYCPGKDVRVHVVGERTFAESIRSDSCDYRRDRGAAHECIALPLAISEGCVALTRRLGLNLAGIDFRTDGDSWWFSK